MADWQKREAARVNNEAANKNAKFKNMMSMITLAGSAKPETMAGYGLGRMLKRWIGTAWDDYMRDKAKKKDNGTGVKTEKGLLPDGVAGGIDWSLPEVQAQYSASIGPVATQQSALDGNVPIYQQGELFPANIYDDPEKYSLKVLGGE